jgi:ribosome biogenesis GTPase
LSKIKPLLQQGIVMRSTGSWYQVRAKNKEIIECRIKGRFRLDGVRTTNPVVVGDYVDYEVMQDGTGVIRTIHERKNYIVRKSVNLSRQGHLIAANIDCAYLIVSLAAPTTSPEFIDRFLVAAEAKKIPVTIVFNKRDLYGETEIVDFEKLNQIYRSIGYQCIAISAFNNEDVTQIRHLLKDKVNLLCGNSGVGKSTLINAVEKDLNLKTAAISERHNEGRHTTTFAEIFPLSNGGFIIDTPGIKGFGIIEIQRENIAHYFPEMYAKLSSCKFSNCIHINEPKCAVKEAVESSEISESRYKSYLSIYETDEDESYR